MAKEPRFHGTPDGRIPFTAEEEARKDAEEKEWFEVEAPAREMHEIRLHRTRLLAETDYLALTDVTMTDAWKNYRQELRDITKTFQSMEDKDFKFPEKPS